MKKKFKKDRVFFQTRKPENIFILLLLLLCFFSLSTIILPVYSQDANKISEEVSPPVYIANFSEPGCHDCEVASRILEQLAFQYPQIEIRKFDISTPEGVTKAEQLGEFYGVPEYDRLLVPLIYIGDEYFLREQITYENIIGVVEEVKKEYIPPPWERSEEEYASIEDRLVERFESIGIWVIVISGLIDGFNPCAFATIIFFISYLSLLKKTGKELLMVGTMFTFSLFVTYFFIGVGALQLATSLDFLPVLRQIFIYAAAVLVVVLGMISFNDYLKYKRTGKTGESSLQLPPRLKQMIHSVIRKNLKTRHFILMAGITGFIIAILELACTGQTYVPTMIFVSRIPELRANALFLLLIYNFMFVAPLIIIFIFTYWGTTSQQWAEMTKKNFGTMKLAMTFLFFGLAIVLFMTGMLF